MEMESLELPWIYAPYVSRYPIASDTEKETVGDTLNGIAQYMDFELVPTDVSPLNVLTVKVIWTLVPVVFCFARTSGGEKLILVLVDFVQTIPTALPHLYVMVCVKLLDCFVTVKVCAVPRVPSLADKVDSRGIVVNVFCALADIVPLETPVV